MPTTSKLEERIILEDVLVLCQFVGGSLRALWQPVRTLYARLRAAVDLLIERVAGIDTAGAVPLRQLGLARSNLVDYEPSPWRTLSRVLRKKDVTGDDVFLDFGCGKGRVLYEAAQYPFGKIIGVELSSELADAARRNLERSAWKLTCSNIHVVNSDVLEFDVPDEVTVVYFYNPFEGEVFAAVVEKLVASLQRKPRTLRIVYFHAREEHMLLRAGARLVKVSHGLRPTPGWARSTSVRLYAMSLPPKPD